MKKIMTLLVLLLFIVACGTKSSNDSGSTSPENNEDTTPSDTVEEKKAEEKTYGPNDPQVIISSPTPGQVVGDVEFLLEFKNTDYPKYIVFYGDKNTTEIGDYFTLDLESGEHTVEVRLLSRDKQVLDSKKVTFTVDKSKSTKKDLPKEEPVVQKTEELAEKTPEEKTAKELLRGETNTEQTPPEPAKVLTGSEETADTSEAKNLGLDFEIKLPAPGYNVKGNLVAARMVPSSKFLFGKIGSNHTPGEGHFHFFINEQKEPLEVDSATYTIKNLNKGTNTLYVEMVRNDHTSYGIKKHVSFEAQTVTSKQ